jgi:hypothetical protein
VSGQFPLSNSATGMDDDTLRQLVDRSQREVANIAEDKILPWPETQRLTDQDIIGAALLALDNNATAFCTCLPSMQNAPKWCKCCSVGVNIPSLSLPATVYPEAKYDVTSNSSITETIISEIDAVQYILPNGMVVCAKWTPDICPGKISMQGCALGGSSELTEVEEAVMIMLDDIAGHSSIKVLSNQGAFAPIVFTGNDILELQSVTKTRVNTQRHVYHRGIGGSCPKDRLELLLSFLVLKLTSQTIDDVAFSDSLTQQIGFIHHKDNSPESEFMNRAGTLTSGDIPICRPLTKAILAQTSSDIARDLYYRAFLATPSEFTFVIMGDLPPKGEFFELINRYMGRLGPVISPFSGPSNMHRDLLDRWVKDIHDPLESNYPYHDIEKDFVIQKTYVKMDTRQSEKSTKLIAFRTAMPIESDDSVLDATEMLDVACRSLQIYLLDELRVRLGKVYSVVVEWSRNSLASNAIISIVMHCDPSDIDLVRRAIEDKILHLQCHGPEETTLNGILEAITRKHKLSLQNSSYWLFWMLDSYKAYLLHAWRNKIHQSNKNNLDLAKDSASWVGKRCSKRSEGKFQLLKESINVSSIQNTIAMRFDLATSVHMDLCPMILENKNGTKDELDNGRICDESCQQLVEVIT